MSCNIISTLLLHNDPDYTLFKVAINFAKQGLSIWFLSIAPFEKIPENIQQPCKEVLQLITFIYLKDYLSLVKHLNGIHKWNNIPNIIIIKDFDKYCNLYSVEYNAVQTAFLSSILLDSAKFLSRKKGCKTFLLVCCLNLNNQKVFESRLQILYDMYFDHFLTKNDFSNVDDLIENIEKKFLMNKTTDK